MQCMVNVFVFVYINNSTYKICSEPSKSPTAKCDGCRNDDDRNVPVLNVDFLLNSRTIFSRPLFNSNTLMTPVAFDLPPIATNFAVDGTHFVSNTVKFSVCSMCENINGCCCCCLFLVSMFIFSRCEFVALRNASI